MPAAIEVSDLGIVASAAAVLVSALFAAGVTIWRTRVLVATGSAQLDRQLTHDREQSDRQLAHDRAQDERQELRQVIDEALRATQETLDVSWDLLGEFNRVVNFNPPRDDEYHRHFKAVSDCLRRLSGLQSRLSVRLPAGAPLPQALEEFRNATSVIYAAAMYGWPEISSSDRDQLSDKIKWAQEASKEFEDQARTLAQSELRIDSDQ